jgi:hypothetical protein
MAAGARDHPRRHGTALRGGSLFLPCLRTAATLRTWLIFSSAPSTRSANCQILNRTLSPVFCLRRSCRRRAGARLSRTPNPSLRVWPQTHWPSSTPVVPCLSIPSMTSRTTEAFRGLLAELPGPVRRQAREAYRRWHVDPWQGGLHFKRVHTREPIWSGAGVPWLASGLCAFGRHGHLVLDRVARRLRYVASPPVITSLSRTIRAVHGFAYLKPG